MTFTDASQALQATCQPRRRAAAVGVGLSAAAAIWSLSFRGGGSSSSGAVVFTRCGSSTRHSPCRPLPLRQGREASAALRATSSFGPYDSASQVQGIEEAISHRVLKARQQRQNARTYRREGADWESGPVLSDGEEIIFDLKHGTNLLLADTHEFPPWAKVRPEHADRGHEYMEKFAAADIWRHHCLVPYLPNDWNTVLDPLERILDKVDRPFAAVQHVKDVIDSSTKFRKAWRYASTAKWNIERRLRRCDRFSRAFLKLLTTKDDSTEAQRRAAAHLMILFEQDGINLQHNGIYRDDMDAFATLQITRSAIFNVSHTWAENIQKDIARRAYLVRQSAELDGVPKWVLDDAAQLALQAGYSKATAEAGPWMISLDSAVVEPVLRHAKGRDFRQLIYGNLARIAFLGGAGKGDNTPVLEEMLRLRRSFANVIGYKSHADIVFTRTMASPKQVYGFLGRLRKESLPKARLELQELQQLARSKGADYDLQYFDLDFWRERLLEERLGLQEVYIRQFFPLPAVLEGLSGLFERLFGIKVVEEKHEQVWAKHVRFFRLYEAETGEFVASFFLDAHRRWGQKQRGSWVSKIQAQLRYCWCCCWCCWCRCCCCGCCCTCCYCCCCCCRCCYCMS
ncbi:unnamed protein product [Polarella glacialis]|uniref:Peptidase M3A/M3B catalytic domain-containing protein n=1 Tax=Polarella glacialis TaxID=89957 RepID=A0A813LD69_POLGL|nr:unnamed protein product [Polarella glacialis]